MFINNFLIINPYIINISNDCYLFFSYPTSTSG